MLRAVQFRDCIHGMERVRCRAGYTLVANPGTQESSHLLTVTIASQVKTGPAAMIRGSPSAETLESRPAEIRGSLFGIPVRIRGTGHQTASRRLYRLPRAIRRNVMKETNR